MRERETYSRLNVCVCGLCCLSAGDITSTQQLCAFCSGGPPHPSLSPSGCWSLSRPQLAVHIQTDSRQNSAGTLSATVSFPACQKLCLPNTHIHTCRYLHKLTYITGLHLKSKSSDITSIPNCVYRVQRKFYLRQTHSHNVILSFLKEVTKLVSDQPYKSQLQLLLQNSEVVSSASLLLDSGLRCRSRPRKWYHAGVSPLVNILSPHMVVLLLCMHNWP